MRGEGRERGRGRGRSEENNKVKSIGWGSTWTYTVGEVKVHLFCHASLFPLLAKYSLLSPGLLSLVQSLWVGAIYSYMYNTSGTLPIHSALPVLNLLLSLPPFLPPSLSPLLPSSLPPSLFPSSPPHPHSQIESLPEHWPQQISLSAD